MRGQYFSHALNGTRQVVEFVERLENLTSRNGGRLELVNHEQYGHLIVENLAAHLAQVTKMIRDRELVMDYTRQPEVPSWVTSVVSPAKPGDAEVKIDVEKLELWQPHHMNERDNITFGTILKRVQRRRFLDFPDLRVAETLLENQFMIPITWRGDGQFFFWGTRVRGAHPHERHDNPKKPSLYIPYIEWNHREKETDCRFELKWKRINPNEHWGRRGNRIVVVSQQQFAEPN
jgi:hypothetical protein